MSIFLNNNRSLSSLALTFLAQSTAPLSLYATTDTSSPSIVITSFFFTSNSPIFLSLSVGARLKPYCPGATYSYSSKPAVIYFVMSWFSKWACLQGGATLKEIRGKCDTGNKASFAQCVKDDYPLLMQPARCSSGRLAGRLNGMYTNTSGTYTAQQFFGKQVYPDPTPMPTASPHPTLFPTISATPHQTPAATPAMTPTPAPTPDPAPLIVEFDYKVGTEPSSLNYKFVIHFENQTATFSSSTSPSFPNDGGIFGKSPSQINNNFVFSDHLPSIWNYKPDLLSNTDTAITVTHGYNTPESLNFNNLVVKDSDVEAPSFRYVNFETWNRNYDACLPEMQDKPIMHTSQGITYYFFGIDRNMTAGAPTDQLRILYLKHAIKRPAKLDRVSLIDSDKCHPYQVYGISHEGPVESKFRNRIAIKKEDIMYDEDGYSLFPYNEFSEEEENRTIWIVVRLNPQFQYLTLSGPQIADWTDYVVPNTGLPSPTPFPVIDQTPLPYEQNFIITSKASKDIGSFMGYNTLTISHELSDFLVDFFVPYIPGVNITEYQPATAMRFESVPASGQTPAHTKINPSRDTLPVYVTYVRDSTLESVIIVLDEAGTDMQGNIKRLGLDSSNMYLTDTLVEGVQRSTPISDISPAFDQTLQARFTLSSFSHSGIVYDRLFVTSSDQYHFKYNLGSLDSLFCASLFSFSSPSYVFEKLMRIRIPKGWLVFDSLKSRSGLITGTSFAVCADVVKVDPSAGSPRIRMSSNYYFQLPVNYEIVIPYTLSTLTQIKFPGYLSYDQSGLSTLEKLLSLTNNQFSPTGRDVSDAKLSGFLRSQTTNNWRVLFDSASKLYDTGFNNKYFITPFESDHQTDVFWKYETPFCWITLHGFTAILSNNFFTEGTLYYDLVMKDTLSSSSSPLYSDLFSFPGWELACWDTDNMTVVRREYLSNLDVLYTASGYSNTTAGAVSLGLCR